jgi:hypothetical protein
VYDYGADLLGTAVAKLPLPPSAGSGF